MVLGVHCTNMNGDTLTVAESKHNIIPEGTTLTVERDHTNEYTGRRTLTVKPDCEVPNRIEGSTLQLFRMDEDFMWTEVHTGLGRPHEQVRLE